MLLDTVKAMEESFKQLLKLCQTSAAQQKFEVRRKETIGCDFHRCLECIWLDNGCVDLANVILLSNLQSKFYLKNCYGLPVSVKLITI